jgi:tetratricopeptide (TPR) repeat protein
MKEVETTVSTSMVYDYNRPLTILTFPNENSSGTIAPLLEDVIKKASFPVQRHKNSNWVDDSYILIGKARYYKEDYDDAIATFKYVNTIGKDLQAKQLALVWLMRSYLKTNELDNALAVSDFIKKEKLNKYNAAQYYLTRAQYYSVTGDPDKTIQNLEYAVPLIEKKDDRSRARFILAQLYQQKGEDKKAYAQYNKILKRNPPYELGFYSKLNLGQVTELSNSGDKKRIEKYYAKLLKDLKNLEYRDKIYYEMAKFELKQNNYDKALKNLAQSTKASTANATQKGYSYLLAGQIYYEKLQNYELAQAYYDSTTKTLPTTAPEYAAITERRDILTLFTTYLSTIQTQDSLITLAKLDTGALNQRLSRYLAVQERKAQEEEAKRQAALAAGEKNASQNNSPTFFNQTNTTSGQPKNTGPWYFDNPTLIGTARADFTRVWGNRKLQDNWRRSAQNAAGPNLQNQTPEEVASADSAKTAQKPDPTIAWRQTFLKDIPDSPAKLKKAEDSLFTAYFKLGNLYNQQLKEQAKAAETFEKLLTRNPQTQYAAEVYYNLYLIYTQLNDPKAETYAARLRTEYPKSSFAKLIDQPDYLQQNAAANNVVRQLYDSAYTLYEKDEFQKAQKLNTEIQKKYPQNDISDKLAFLDLMLIGKTQKVAVYKDALNSFILSNPGSPLALRAQEILAALNNYETAQASLASQKNQPPPPVTQQPPVPIPAPVAPVNYKLNPDSPHLFVIAFPINTEALGKLPNQLSRYHDKYYQTDNLSVTPYLLGDSLELVVIKTFPDAKRAHTYGVKQKSPQAPLAKLRGIDFTTFVISAENFPVFYKANNLEEYMAFYRKNYQK